MTNFVSGNVWRTGIVDNGTSSTQLHIVCHLVEPRILRRDVKYILDPGRRYRTEAEYQCRMHKGKDLTSLTVSRESLRDEKNDGYSDFGATDFRPRLDICIIPV